MTRFEKDYSEMLKGAGRYILEDRMKEMIQLGITKKNPVGTGL